MSKNEMKTATEVHAASDLRMDLRKKRVLPIIYQIVETVRPHLDPNNDRAERDICNALMDLLWQNGVEIITDDMRREIGLPPRDGLGWTAYELAALEKNRLELITRPLGLRIPDPFSEDATSPK